MIKNMYTVKKTWQEQSTIGKDAQRVRELRTISTWYVIMIKI